MSHARALFRLTLLALIMLVLIPLWIIWSILASPFPSLKRTLRRTWMRWWAWITAIVLRTEWRISGTPPKRPFILVANHLSYVDAMVMAFTTRAVLIGKLEIEGWPIIGWLGRNMGMIFIDRSLRKDVVRVNAIIERTLANGDGVAFFPEGTTTDGSHVGEFRSSLLNYPATAAYPVHHATIRYHMDHGDATTQVCWWGDMTFADHFYRLAGARGFRAEVHFGEDTVTQSDRKELTRELHRRVEAAFEPVT